MFTDERRRIAWQRMRQRGMRQFNRFLTPALLAQAAVDAQVTMGAGALNLATLTWLGIASAFHLTQNFAGILVVTLKLLQDLGAWRPKVVGSDGPRPDRQNRPSGKDQRGRRRRQRPASKHDPHGQDPNILSEEAFAQARHRMPLRYWMALILLLNRAFEAEHRKLVYWRGHRLLTLDGSCIQLPGRQALAGHFGTARNGKGCVRGRSAASAKRTVQARMVMLQLPLVRIPWRYELTPLQQGERTVAARLLRGLGEADLVLMDRGFFSYGLFWQIQRQRAFFAVRLMKGTKFQTLRRLGRQDRLVSWTPADRQWKKARLPASIRLRVIDYQVPGFRPSAIVTNVLDPRQISRPDWVRLTTQSDPGRKLDPGLYHRRWEIETTFCELKVEQGMEGGLRSRTPEGIAYEVAGHVLLYLLVRWLMVEAALEHGLDPLRVSFKNALRELEGMAPALLVASPRRVAEQLLPRLLERIAAHVVPWRPGRYDPRPGDTRIKNKGKGRYQLPSRLPTKQA
jgi:hypothetical protein